MDVGSIPYSNVLIMDVSIVIPVYNVSAYIERCIKSVMRQTFSGLMECIIVDDCSPDDSIEKCSRIIKSYNGNVQFRILRHENNKGLSASRNTGTKFAIGEFVFYLDSDDEITPNCVDVLFKEASCNPQVEIVQGYTDSIPFVSWYPTDRYKIMARIDDNRRIRLENYKIFDYLPCNAWNKLIRLSFLRSNSLYFKEGVIHEDHLWMCNVTKRLEHLSFVFIPTYIHYATPNSIMTSRDKVSKQKSMNGWLSIIENAVETKESPFITNQLVRYYWELFTRSLYKSFKGKVLVFRYSFHLFMRGYFKIAIAGIILCVYFSDKIYNKMLRKLQIIDIQIYQSSIMQLKA